MKLPSGSWRRKAAALPSRPFSSTRTRCVPQNMALVDQEVLVPGGAPARPPGIAVRGRSGVEDACWVVCHVVCCVFTCFVRWWFTTSPHNSPRFATTVPPPLARVNGHPQHVGAGRRVRSATGGTCGVTVTHSPHILWGPRVWAVLPSGGTWWG